MKGFFFLIEILIPIVAVFLVFQKKSLAIVYVPLFMFSYHIIETRFPGFFQQFIIVGLLAYFVFYNLPFVKENVFSVLIFLYFLFLLKNVEVEFKVIRPYLVNVSWVFLGISLIPYIFKRYEREVIFKEISYVSFLIMSLFIINTFLSTVLKYNPREIYGFSTGVFFGNISNDYYNIFPLSIYLILRRALSDKKPVYMIVYFISVFLVLLTMRRSVMVLSILGTFLVLIEFFEPKKIKQFVFYVFLILIVGTTVVLKTDFLPQFVERYERRNIENRSLENEGRLMELGIIYKDLFVYFDYDPWFGYRLNDSWGNYGKKIFGDRSLHTDFAHIIHSSGIFGLCLYLLMSFFAFSKAWKYSLSKSDQLQFLFISLCFLVYFINGRYTTANAMLMMFGILNLPLSIKNKAIPN